MDSTNAPSGWNWVRQGFVLFRKQPAELLTMFFAYTFVNMGISILPLAGQILPLLLIPVWMMGFMQACVQVEQGVKVSPSVLMTGFRITALPRLLTFGSLYLLAAIAAIAGSRLVDDGVFWDFVINSKPAELKDLSEINLFPGMAAAMLAYAPALMAFWFAAPLIAWKDMPLGKALFYSFFAVWRARKAFFAYGLIWTGIGIVLPAIFSLLIAALFGAPMLALLLILPVTLVLTVVMYCSFYPTYTDIFGQPEQTTQSA